MIDHLGRGFRDELLATGLVMLISVVGSYYVIHLRLNKPGQAPVVVLDEKVLGAKEETGQDRQDSGESTIEQAIKVDVESEEAEPTPTPTPPSSNTPKPSATPNQVEIQYGINEEFENDYYIVSFSNPRLVVGNSRVFKVDVVIANKAVETEIGLHNRLHARIEREGEVIIEQAAMSNTEIKQIKQGQQLTFTASISLVSQTDISRIYYKPDGEIPEVVYEVGPLM